MERRHHRTVGSRSTVVNRYQSAVGLVCAQRRVRSLAVTKLDFRSAGSTRRSSRLATPWCSCWPLRATV